MTSNSSKKQQHRTQCQAIALNRDASAKREQITRYVITGTILLALIFILQGCAADQPETEEGERKVRVSTATVKAMDYTPSLRLPGTLFANREANLGAGLPGKLEKIHQPKGSRVKEGQLLAELSGEMLSQAEAEYMTLQKDYERVSRLVKNGTVSQQEYDHIKARYDAAKAKYELAQKNTRIRAPFSGTIVDFLIQEGENYFLNINMEPGYSNTSGILRLMQLDPLKAEVEINERDLGHIKPGLKAKVVPEAFPDDVYEGTVTELSPYLSTRSRSATAEIRISNPEKRLKPGMSAEVTIIMPEKKVHTVPLEALYRDPETGEEKLYAVKDQRARAVPFSRIENLGEHIIVEGPAEGTEVILGGKSRVEDDREVIIVNEGGNK